MTSIKTILSYMGLSNQNYCISMVKDLINSLIDEDYIEVGDIWYSEMSTSELKLNTDFIIFIKETLTDVLRADDDFLMPVAAIEFFRCNDLCHKYNFDVFNCWHLWLVRSAFSNVSYYVKKNNGGFCRLSSSYNDLANATGLDIKTVGAYMRAFKMNEEFEEISSVNPLSDRKI